MKKISAFLLLLTMIILFSSCEKVTGEGPLVTEQRNVSDYAGVDLRCSANVSLTESNNHKVEVSAQKNILDVLITEVVNNVLVIRYRNDVNVRSHDAITIAVSGPVFNRLRISGSGNIASASLQNAGNMDLDISGSGNMTVSELKTGNIHANISGSGNINMIGSADEEQLTISGSGNINLANVAARKATTTTSGSGEIRVNLTQDLDARISGSGSVYYKGNPVVNTHISGSGKVIHVD